MSIKISILVEGETEKAFFPKLREFLNSRLPANTMPKLDSCPKHGRLPTGDKLKRDVMNLLSSGKQPSDAVIALSDVYTGTREFADAQDAKRKMREWVGKEQRFYPHVANHDFEAWLLPFWKDIQKLAGSNRTCPSVHPEYVNHGNPPAHLMDEIFRSGSKGKKYIKPRDAARILRDNDLLIAANACPELKEFLNTILFLCGAAKL
ncbi:MAG: DUF4276 family protein [Holophaga sp.]|nr:DUF4276 family protein [Holophaga sp.]